MIKKSIYLLFAAIVVGGLFFISCNREEDTEPVKSGEIVFSLNEIASETNAAIFKSTDAKDDAVAIVVTIIGSLGDTMYYQEQLELYNLNGSFISEAIILPEGEYELTEFLILDEENNVIYLTPMEGSKYAYLVSDPLGISFEVMIDQVTKVVPEVISTDCICTPIDFGYSGFDFNIVDIFCILLNAQVYDETEENYVFINANVTIEGDGQVIFEGELPAGTDSVKIPDGFQEYRLLVSKDGVSPFDTLMTNDEIKAFVDFPLEFRWPFRFLIDIEGNLYPVVTICDQVWMASNLRTKTRSDGTTPILPTPVGFSAEYLDYGDPLLEAEYGLLYTDVATLYVPTGWHIPSDEEWMELELCLGMDPAVLEDVGERGTNQGDLLKVGGTTGFNALYGGRAHWTFLYNAPPPIYYDLEYRYIGAEAYFRTTTVNLWDEYYPDYIYRAIGDSYSGIRRNAYHSRAVDNYYSVRCVKD